MVVCLPVSTYRNKSVCALTMGTGLCIARLGRAELAHKTNEGAGSLTGTMDSAEADLRITSGTKTSNFPRIDANQAEEKKISFEGERWEGTWSSARFQHLQTLSPSGPRQSRTTGPAFAQYRTLIPPCSFFSLQYWPCVFSPDVCEAWDCMFVRSACYGVADGHRVSWIIVGKGFWKRCWTLACPHCWLLFPGCFGCFDLRVGRDDMLIRSPLYS